ncbi:hypothetical protein BDR06DRAFT_964267 [Suillus hirtellus]|nr:hypothetical protein BDR06DRAFT_964267 [Suillus hirtellus]
MAGEAGPGQRMNAHLFLPLLYLRITLTRTALDLQAQAHPLHPWLDAPSSHPQKRTIAHPKSIDVSPHGPPSAAGGCETASDGLRPKGGVGSDDDVGWMTITSRAGVRCGVLVCGACLECVQRLPASKMQKRKRLSFFSTASPQ